MWAHDFLAAEPVAKTYLTHIKSNNVVGRWWYSEYYLPQKSRLSSALRFIRLSISLCLFLIIVAHITDGTNWEYGAQCLRRLDCKINCVHDNFPNLNCHRKAYNLLATTAAEVDDLSRSSANARAFTITYAGNVYSRLFDYRLASDEKANAQGFNDCRNVAVPKETMTATQTVESLLHDSRLPRTQICFPPCRDLDPTYPGQSLIGAQYMFGGSTAGSSAWSSGLNTNTTTLLGDDRPSCSQLTSDDQQKRLICVDDSDSCEKTIYKSEICLNCATGEPVANVVGSVDAASAASSSSAEAPASDHAGLRARRAGCWCFTIEHIIVCMCVALPFLFLYNVLTYFTSQVDVGVEDGSVANGCLKCGMQWVCSIVAVSTILYTASVLVRVAAFGRAEMVLTTWFLVVLADQVRNIIVQSLVWYCLIRRFGQVPVMDEEEYFAEHFADGDVEDTIGAMQVIQGVANSCLEWRRFDLLIYSILGLYAIFLLTLIAVQDYLTAQQQAVFEDVDTAFLALFALEILIRVTATGMIYFYDLWNVFDFAIVLISWVFALQRYANPEEATSSTTLALLRLLRLLRLVNGLRKLTSTKRSRVSGQSGLNFSSPVERVLEILKEVKTLKIVTKGLQEEITWAMDIVSSNKLYSISVDTSDKSGAKGSESLLEQELSDWVRLVSDNQGTHSGPSWQENELERFLVGQTKKREHQENLEQARRRLLLFIEQDVVKRMPSDGSLRCETREELAMNEMDYSVYLSARVQSHVLAMLEEGLHIWDFNIYSFALAVGPDDVLPLIFAETFLFHELTATFEMTLDPVIEYARALTKGYVESNPYHNSLHAADVLQGFHVLLTWFLKSKNTGAIAAHDVLAGLLAAAIHDYEHPGVSNAFLVRTRHPIALRYNDSAVLENHHVSAAFHLMLDLSTKNNNSNVGTGASAASTTFEGAAATGGPTTTATPDRGTEGQLEGASTAASQQGGEVRARASTNQASTGNSAGTADLLGSLSEGQYQQVRRMCIDMVLATDSSSHFAELSLFKTKINTSRNGSFPDSKQYEDKQILMNILLHAADISNACRPGEVYVRHVQRTMEEFFRQGDIERDKNMPVSMFFDRETTSTPKCQQAFIDVVVLPLFTVLGNYLPEVSGHCLENLWANRAHVQSQDPEEGRSRKTEKFFLASSGGKTGLRHNLLNALRVRMNGVMPPPVVSVLKSLSHGKTGTRIAGCYHSTGKVTRRWLGVLSARLKACFAPLLRKVFGNRMASQDADDEAGIPLGDAPVAPAGVT
ncbi:unnamed protein product [Amoebophrya sp. A25]|nr:unnamed protein product [Amoebophrya sp. A25]|eukprot:GSA25T00027284001.1